MTASDLRIELVRATYDLLGALAECEAGGSEVSRWLDALDAEIGPLDMRAPPPSDRPLGLRAAIAVGSHLVDALYVRPLDVDVAQRAVDLVLALRRDEP